MRSFRYRSEGGQMPRIKNHNFVTFNDGILQICELSERKIVKTKMDRVRYGDMTVGIKRFWDAKVAGNDIEKTVAIPKISDISRMDLILINGKQYKIEQIQDKFDQMPPYLLLSLSKSPIAYKDVR